MRSNDASSFESKPRETLELIIRFRPREADSIQSVCYYTVRNEKRSKKTLTGALVGPGTHASH